MTNERTTARVATIAARVLRNGTATRTEALILAASALTQAPDKRGPYKPRKAKRKTL